MSKRTIIAAIVLAGLLAGGKQGWAADNLQGNFINPPDSAKPTVYWWWLYDRVDKEAITRDMEEFKDKGIGGANLICMGGHAGEKPHLGVDFLSPQWRELFRHAVKEADRMGIEMGFNMAAGWVMHGPWVTPELAMKKVVQTEVSIKGPGKVSIQLKQPKATGPAQNNCRKTGYYRDAAVQAFRVLPDQSLDPKSAVDLTARMKVENGVGLLDWNAPEGDWIVFRSGYMNTGSGLWMPPNDIPKGGEGYQIDYMNAAALDDHFEHLGRVVLDEAKKAGGKLTYLWSDSWEGGTLTWTQDFPNQFKRFRGYDPLPYLPALSGHVVINANVTKRFQQDIDRTIGDCVAENFYGHFAELCHRNGLEMRNEAAGPGDLPPWDGLKNLGRCDVPGGEFWMERAGLYKCQDGYNVNLKQTASAGHIYGRNRVNAEAFTQMGPRSQWYYGPSDMKPFGDSAFCEGINLFMLHAATCQSPSDGKPGYVYGAGQRWEPNITWWPQSKAFFSYLARCQYLLQQGLFVGDVCYFLGEEPPIVAPPKHSQTDLAYGYDCDYCNAEVLLNRMSVKDGRIVLPDGMSYALLVLQNCTILNEGWATAMTKRMVRTKGVMGETPVTSKPSRAMSVEVARKIRELVREGATVIGAPPLEAAGLKDYPACDAEVRAIAAEVWGDCDGQTKTEHAYGKGRVIWGKSAQDILEAKGVLPDFTYPDQKQNPLDFIHRSTGSAEIYFVSNRTAKEKKTVCTFRVKGKSPELWDPVSGTMRRLPEYQRTEDGRIAIPLEFAPHGSAFVVFRDDLPKAEKGGRNFPVLMARGEIAGAWEVRFDPTWGGPASVEFSELISWTKRPEEGIKFYSGKATYCKSFDCPGGETRKAGERLFLDFGNIRHVAEVRLNGKSLGILWTSPWRVEITDVVKPTGNALEVDVVNLWANRVIGDMGLPLDKRVAKTEEKFRFGDLTKDMRLLDSGLLGPVRVMAEQ